MLLNIEIGFRIVVGTTALFCALFNLHSYFFLAFHQLRFRDRRDFYQVPVERGVFSDIIVKSACLPGPNAARIPGMFGHPPGSVSGKELFHIPPLVCASQRFARENPEKIVAVRQNSTKTVSHDQVSHGLMDEAGIVSPFMGPGLSLLRDCLNHPACTLRPPSSAFR